MIQHLDKIGNPLKENDCVVFSKSNNLCIGTIIKINSKMVKVVEIGSKGFWSRGFNFPPENVVKLDNQEITMYLLKNSK
jgi:hypothetical protein